MTRIPVVTLAVLGLAVAASYAAAPSRSLYRFEASRMSMACLYSIDAYGPSAIDLPRVLEEAFDEVDRIDRLMSHYKVESPLSQLNREAGRQAVRVDAELFDLIATSIRYSQESLGAFDITVGPLMKTWGFFRGEGRVPSEDELAVVRRSVGARHVRLDAAARSIAFDDPGVELDLGGIAKGYAVDRVAALLRRRGIPSALISAGGSTIFGLGSPPDREGWEVTIEDPIDPRKTALSVRLRDRALSVAGSSEKFFEVAGKAYAHIMDPRTGRPVEGVLSVAVLSSDGTMGDALDDALFVLGPEGSRAYLQRLPGTEAMFFLPAATKRWTLVRQKGGTH